MLPEPSGPPRRVSSWISARTAAFWLPVCFATNRPCAAAPDPGSGLDKEYKILLDALAFEPASVDSLIERTGLNSESIASMLLILELDGHVAPHPGGRYSRMAGR